MNRTLILTFSAEELDELLRLKARGELERFVLDSFETSEEQDSLIVSYVEKRETEGDQ